jgi:hypothetical protein
MITLSWMVTIKQRYTQHEKYLDELILYHVTGKSEEETVSKCIQISDTVARTTPQMLKGHINQSSLNFNYIVTPAKNLLIPLRRFSRWSYCPSVFNICFTIFCMKIFICIKDINLAEEYKQKQTKNPPWPLVRKRTLPTEWPPLVDEI